MSMKISNLNYSKNVILTRVLKRKAFNLSFVKKTFGLT